MTFLECLAWSISHVLFPLILQTILWGRSHSGFKWAPSLVPKKPHEQVAHHRFRAHGSHCPPETTGLGICSHMVQVAGEKAEPPGEVLAFDLKAASWNIHCTQKFRGGDNVEIKADVLYNRMQTLTVR